MICQDYDKEVKYLMKRSGCTEEQAYAYLEKVDEFYDSKNMNTYDTDEAEKEVKEHSEPYDGADDIDNDEMVQFVVDRTDMDFDFVEQLSFYELDFLYGDGFTEDFVPRRERMDLL